MHESTKLLRATSELAQSLGIEQTADLIKGLRKIIQQRFLVSMVRRSSTTSPLSTRETKATSEKEVRGKRYEVRAMVIEKKPIPSIALYRGKKIHGDPVVFFREQYAAYIIPGQEVIFSSDLQVIDKKLLLALRNECRHDVPLAIGGISARTDALLQGRFTDKRFTPQRAHSAMAYRERCHAQIKVKAKAPK